MANPPAEQPQGQGQLNIQPSSGPAVLVVNSTRMMKMLSISESEMQQLQTNSGISTIFFSISTASASACISLFKDYMNLPIGDLKIANVTSNALIFGFVSFLFICGALYINVRRHDTVQRIKKESGYPPEDLLPYWQDMWNKIWVNRKDISKTARSKAN